jgi:hypothetical protein
VPQPLFRRQSSWLRGALENPLAAEGARR